MPPLLTGWLASLGSVKWLIAAAATVPFFEVVLFSKDALFGALGPLVIVVLAGFFTLRSNIARNYREIAQAEQARAEELRLQLKDMTTARDEQRMLKHECKSELAAMRMKTDVTPVLQAISASQEQLTAFYSEFLNRGDGERFDELRAAIQESEARMVEQLKAMTRTQNAQAKAMESLAERMGNLEEPLRANGGQK